MKPSGSLYKIAAISFIVAFVYMACKKTEVTVNNANIKMINASPGSPGLSLYINSKLVTDNIEYADSTPYNPTTPGTYFTEMKKTGENDAFYSFTATLSPSRYYTLFAVGLPGALKPAVIEDKLIVDTANAKIRFFNFVPNGDTLTVFFRNTDTTSLLTYTGRRFNDQDSVVSLQQFSTMPADTCNLLIVRSKDSSLVYQTKDMIFPKGTFHTFYLEGLKDGTAPDTLALKYIRQ